MCATIRTGTVLPQITPKRVYVSFVPHKTTVTETQEVFQKILTGIAEKNLGMVTLETRNDDFLDFHDLAVWQIKEALKDAFIAGMNTGMTL